MEEIIPILSITCIMFPCLAMVALLLKMAEKI